MNDGLFVPAKCFVSQRSSCKAALNAENAWNTNNAYVLDIVANEWPETALAIKNKNETSAHVIHNQDIWPHQVFGRIHNFLITNPHKQPFLLIVSFVYTPWLCTKCWRKLDNYRNGIYGAHVFMGLSFRKLFHSACFQTRAAVDILCWDLKHFC